VRRGQRDPLELHSFALGRQRVRGCRGWCIGRGTRPLEFLLGLSIGFGPPVASSLQFLFSTEFLYMSIGEAVPAPFFSSDTQENCASLH
jgi:hypothetical protein